MAIVDTLKFLDLNELDSNQKRELKKILVNHKKALQARIRSIDKEIALLDPRPRGRGRATKKAYK